LVTLTDIATAVGYPPAKTVVILARTGLAGSYVRLRHGRRAVYDQRVIDVLHAVLGQPHRPLEGPESDWLAQWLQRGGETHG